MHLTILGASGAMGQELTRQALERGHTVTAATAGPLTRLLLRTFLRDELEDKVTADTLVLGAGGTVFHAGPISNGPLSPTRHTVSLDLLPRRLFPASVSRAILVAAMLDEAENQHHAGHVVVPSTDEDQVGGAFLTRPPAVTHRNER